MSPWIPQAACIFLAFGFCMALGYYADHRERQRRMAWNKKVRDYRSIVAQFPTANQN